MQIQHPFFKPPARRAGGHLLVPLLTLLGGLLWFGAQAPVARADGCEDCAAPTVADVQAQTGVKLKTRPGIFGPARDTMEMDAGDCSAQMVAPPEITRLRSWLVLRAMGEVFNCPSVKSSAAVVAETRQSDSSSWSLAVKGSFKLKGLVAEVSAEISTGQTTGVTITEVTRVTQTLQAGSCRRIPWRAYFEVGEFRATAEFAYTQTWAWWTKNATTGASVHAKGTIQVDCGSAEVTLQRKAPVAGYFELSQGACGDPECGPRADQYLGFFPRLPPYLPDPGTTPKSAGDDGGSGDGASSVRSSDELGGAPSGPLPDPQAPDDGAGLPPSGPLPDPLGSLLR